MATLALDGTRFGVTSSDLTRQGTWLVSRGYDLGQAANVVALSVTEGEDKPIKYPVMFRKADLVLLTKVDLLPYLDFRVEAVLDALGRVMPQPEVRRVSARTGEGIPEWVAWLEARRARQAAGVGAAAHPHQHA